MTVKVGFTGTRRGMSPSQLEKLESALARLNPSSFHHGDCIGADAQAHKVARSLGLRVILHPPNNPKARAFCDWDECRPEAPYLTRNREIVLECEVIIAAPFELCEQLRSGTWATIRYARSNRRTLVILRRDQ